MVEIKKVTSVDYIKAVLEGRCPNCNNLCRGEDPMIEHHSRQVNENHYLEGLDCRFCGLTYSISLEVKDAAVREMQPFEL